MKKTVFYLIFSCMATMGFSQDDTKETIGAARDECPDDPYFLLFSDEFEGNTINTDKWYTYFGGAPDGSDACIPCRTSYNPDKPESENGSDQVYKDENVVVSDGVLKIITKKEPSVWMGHHSDYTSGVIRTKPDFSYGSYMKWEARIRLPADHGLWPAFWGYSGVSEIDFMEVWNSGHDIWGHKRKLQFTTHRWEDDVRVDQDFEAYYGIDLSSDFHIYTTEYDPLYVRFYLDGVLMHTVTRLSPIYLNQSVSCDLEAGTYYRNLAFPVYGLPMQTIINNAVDRKRPPGDDFVSATMEVDYVRIYARGCPWTFWDTETQNITEDKTVEYPNVLNYNYINVAEGKTLTIRNTTIQLNDYGTITLGRGSRLILDNSTLTSCNPNQKWNGIVAGKNAVIEMKNRSVIEKAYKGITLGGDVINGGDPSSVTDNPRLVMDSHSTIRNCDIGIHFGAGKTTSFISDNAKFANNKTAILAMSSTGLVIDNALFLHNSQSIRAMDSYLHVRDGNYFDGGTRAIYVSGTYPGVAGIDIGDAGRGYNYFAFQDAYAIDCSGAEHPAGANVVNCKFSRIENGGAATAFLGANQMMFENNTVGYSDRGLVSRATGNNFNYTQCNLFDHTTVLDVAYAYDNKRSQFLGNQSAGLHAVNYFLLNATMPNNIGSQANPAGNCFSGDIPDITTMLNTQSFNYHFYDDGHTTMCEEPITPGNYTKVPTPNDFVGCEGGVGIFGLIDPDGDGVNGFLPSTSAFVPAYSGHLTKSAVRDRIGQSILAVVSAGGDDPRTLADETVGTKSVTAFEKEAIADQWIRYAVMRGMDEGDYAYAESTLSTLKQAKWQHRLFGLRLWQAKYAEAEAMLATLPARNEDETYFNEVQAINIKRLHGLRNGAQLTANEVGRLQAIANSTEPSSAYARSLYYVLTGELIDYALPDPGAGPAMTGPGEAVITGISTGDKAGEVRFYPNPVTDELHVESATVLSGVEIIDMTGRVLLSRAPGGNTAVFNTARLARGMYVIRIENSDGNVIFDKMIKL